MLAQQVGNRRHGGFFVTLLLAVLLAGCASPGVPRAPSLRLPAPVRNLSAERRGDAVLLRFSAPQETTDHQSLTTRHGPAPMTAIVCRAEGAQCMPFRQIAAEPGAAYEVLDPLPPLLTVGPIRPLAYRVTVRSRSGRDAGPSRDAVAAAGQAPPPVTGLTAKTTDQGIQLTWVPLDGVAVRVEAQMVGAAPARQNDRPRLLQPAVGGTPQHDSGGAVDPVPTTGQQVSYRVYRQQAAVVNGVALTLQGASAQVTTVRAPDTFAPGAPTGLLAASFSQDSGAPVAPPVVQLSWEPNTEPDLAGYLLYRAEGAGEFRRILSTPTPGISYADKDVRPGVTYRYAVTAVDRSGNESTRSAVADANTP